MFINPRNNPNDLSEGFYERFYSFISLEKSRSTQRKVIAQWKWDPKTRRHMRQLLEQEPEESKKNEENWVIHFCENLFTEYDLKSTKCHLLAYLQDACNMTRSIVQGSPWFEILWPRATAPEIFSFISEILVQDLQILLELGIKKYDFSKFSYKSFSRFIAYKLENKTKEKLRAGKQKTKYSEAALLKFVSQKEIEKALKAQGIIELINDRQIHEVLKQVYQDQDENQSKINQKLQLWNCYQHLVKLEKLRFRNISLSKISQRQKQTIADRYKSKTHCSISVNEIQKQLNEIYKIIYQASQHYKYLSVCKIYKDLIVPNKLTKSKSRYPWPPTTQECQIIADCYNQKILYKSITSELTKDNVRIYLDFCVDAIRKQYKTIEKSVDQDAGYFTFTELNYDPIEQHENEENDRKNEIQHFLQEQLNNLSPKDRWVLKLDIGLGINKTDTGKILGVVQSTITRKIQSIKQKLLKAISVFVKQKWDVELNTEIISNEIFILLDQSLAKAIHIEIWDILQYRLEQKTEHQITLLKSWNAILWECNGNNHLALQQISNRFSCDGQQIKQQLEQIKQDLYLELLEICQQKIQQDLNSKIVVNLQDLPSTPESLLKIVDDWLNKIAQY